jgi:protocatechuate 3,4-dioxygenase beta subunit
MPYLLTERTAAMADHADEVPDGGLDLDLPRLLSRRCALILIGSAGVAAALAACGSDNSSSAASSSAPPADVVPEQVPTTDSPIPSPDSSAAAATVDGSCDVIPDETGGPFPGDGTNGQNVLIESGVVRRDIRTSIGAASGTAEGVPLTIRFNLIDVANGCQPLANAAIYAWHCTRDGGYSMYSAGFESENFLRGVQVSGADGVVEFDSIYPGCYSGRWPHIHFEVYPSLDAATTQSGHIKTSQIAMPKTESEAVYAAAGYEASAPNLKQVSLANDNVFGDDSGANELGTVSGDQSSGLTGELTVAVDSAVTPSMGGGAGGPGGPPGPPPGSQPGGPPPSGDPGGPPSSTSA